MESEIRGVLEHERNRVTKSEDTIVEITNLATGGGNTTRRLRTSSNHEVCKDFLGPDGSQNTRLKTPSPKWVAKPVVPPKFDRKSRGELRSMRRYSGDNLSLNFPENEVEDILENSRRNISHLFQELCKYVPKDRRSPQSTAVTNKPRNGLGSPFQERPLQLPSESPPASRVIQAPPSAVTYDLDYKNRPSSGNLDVFQSSNRYQVLVDHAEPWSGVRHVDNRRVS